MLILVFKDATSSPPPNLHTFILLVEVYRFGECLSEKFSLVSSRAFKDASHSRFECRDPNQCLPKFLKVLLLALPQIYTRVWYACVGYSLCLIFFGWILVGCRFPPISTFFSLVCSRAFRDGPHSSSRCRDPNQCLPKFTKMLLLALPQIYTRVFHLWKSIDFDSAWVGHSRSYQLSFLSYVLARLEMRHTRVLSAGIPTDAYLTFSRCYFPPCPKSHTCFSLVDVYRFEQCLGVPSCLYQVCFLS